MFAKKWYHFINVLLTYCVIIYVVGGISFDENWFHLTVA